MQRHAAYESAACAKASGRIPLKSFCRASGRVRERRCYEKTYARSFGGMLLGGRLFFHAGDLNNWQPPQSADDTAAMRAEAMFLGELKDLRKVVDAVDVAMFPIDARIGGDYIRGARQFVARMTPRLFVPMHFTACGEASAGAFAPEAEALGCRFWLPGGAGDGIVLP